MEKRIISYVRALKLKLFTQKLLKNLIFATLLASIINFVLMTLSRFASVPMYLNWIKTAYIIAFSSAVIFSIIRFPKNKAVIKLADKLAFKERLMTAFEFAKSQDEAILLQRQDAIDMMQKIDLSSLYKIKLNAKIFLLLILFCALSFGVSFIETKSSAENISASNEIKEIRAEAKKLDKALKESLKAAGLDPKDMDNIEKKLKSKLAKSKTKKDALKALSITKNELKDLKAEAKKQGKNISEDEKKALAEAVKKIDEAGIKMAGKAISDFAFKESEKSGSEKESNSAENQSNSASGSGDQSQGQASNSNSSSSSSSSSSASSSQGQSSNQSGEGASGESSEAGGQGKGQGQGEGQGQGQGQGEGEGEGQGQGQGQGEGQGEGQGQGEGEGQGGGHGQRQGQSQGQGGGDGGGAGSGSSNENSPYMQEQGGSAGKNPGEHKVEIYEALYMPERLGGQSDPDYVSGEKSGKSDITYKDAQNLPKESGDFVDYKEVYTEYSEKAIYNSESMDIPNGMKGVVKDYFESLNE